MAGSKRGPRSPREKEKRREKLADIRKQLADGSLVIRKMTPTERKRNPAKPRRKKGR